MVLVAGGDTAGGQDQIVGACDLLQAVRHRGAVVPDDAEIAELAAEPGQHRRQHEAVGIEQLRSRALAARRNQLVAGRKYRDAKPSRHIDMGQTEGGGKRDILRPQPAACLQRRLAERNVFSCGAHIGAGFEASRENHPARIIDADIFLHEHGVGAVGHRRAGKDPNRLAPLDRLACRRAGLNATHDLKRPLLALRQVAAAHGITVDGGIGERRQRQRRLKIAGENPPIGPGERNALDLRHRGYPRGDDGNGLIDRHHRPAEGEAIVGQLRHPAS